LRGHIDRGASFTAAFKTFTYSLTSFLSLAPKAIDAWKADLTSKGRAKVSNTIADPKVNPELFEEGWEAAVEKEERLLSEGALVEVS